MESRDGRMDSRDGRTDKPGWTSRDGGKGPGSAGSVQALLKRERGCGRSAPGAGFIAPCARWAWKRGHTHTHTRPLLPLLSSVPSGSSRQGAGGLGPWPCLSHAATVSMTGQDLGGDGDGGPTPPLCPIPPHEWSPVPCLGWGGTGSLVGTGEELRGGCFFGCPAGSEALLIGFIN